MSSLDKVAIRGIRSFDHNELNVVQFFSPLTLIVGQNGSGKTTVIEALKYITTGDMPPNTKGGAFVHDPNMAGETTVNAQVKLRFRNTAGEEMVVDRRLSVTKKKTGGLTMKTLEGTLSYADSNGEKNKRASISTKCSELEDEVPNQLGVSKAILENVIFCHQEESNWPLSEPAALKKKFDEIFEASKYTKALDQIKSIRKEQNIDLKVARERLAALKTDRERANKLNVSINGLAELIESKLAEHGALEAEIQTLAETNSRFYDQAAKYTSIINEHNSLQEKINVHRAAADRLRQSIIDLRSIETDTELQARLGNHEGSLAMGRQRLNEEQSRLADEEREFAMLQSKQLRRQAELGRAQADVASFDRATQARIDLVRSLSVALAVQGFDRTDLASEEIDNFIKLLNRHLSSLMQESERIRSEGETAAAAKTEEIMRLRNDENSHVMARNNTRERVGDLRKRIARLNNHIESSATSEADVELKEQKLQDKRVALEDARGAFRAAGFDEGIRQKQTSITSLEAQRENLHTELTSLNRQADARAKLAVKRADLGKNEQLIQDLIQGNGDHFFKCVGKTIARNTLDNDITAAVARKEQELEVAERQHTFRTRDQHSAESEASNTESQLRQLTKQLEDCRQRVQAATEGGNLDQLVEEARSELDQRRSTIDNSQFSQDFFNNLLQRGQKHNACTACSRPFSKSGDLDKFEAFCQDQVRKAPKNKADAEEELRQWQDELKKLQAVQPDATSCKQLEERDIPNAAKAQQRAASKLKDATEQVTTAKHAYDALKAENHELQALKRFAADTVRLDAAQRDLRREIAQLEKDLEVSGSTRTTEDIHAELESHARDLDRIKREVRTAEHHRTDKTSEISKMEKTILEGQLAIQQLRTSLSETSNFRKQVDEAKEEIAQLEQKTKAADANIANLVEPINNAEEGRRVIYNEYRTKCLAAEGKRRRVEEGLAEIERAVKEVAKYRATGSAPALRALEDQLSSLDQEVCDAQRSISDCRKFIDNLKDEAGRAGAVKRNLQDNIELRTHKSDVLKLEGQIADLDIEGAHRAKRRFDTDYNESRQKQANMAAKQARLGGEIETSKRSLEEKRRELKTEYNNIHDMYRSQLVKVKIGELSNNDLEKYAKALDTAIMKYHEHKMREINDSIQALWTKTYQGTDVDTIMIRSDNEQNKGNRTYNYRVVMLKDKVELDMRGRCSAGQKVLASIIIRLALAESFGTNCGILALDEPTTNLDKENVTALAHALADIIEERRSQSNFQLVIITHDEDLLELLGKSIEKYWRVSRNERQKSVIMRQRVDNAGS